MTREEAIILIERAANELREMMKTITMPTSAAEQLQQEIYAHEIAISALRQQELSSYSQVVESRDMFDEDGGEILNDETVTDRHQMTNADRIRAMSDEGKRQVLIEYFSEWAGVGDSYIFDLTRVKSAFAIGTMSFDDFKEWGESRIEELVDELIAWLQQPAEEADHDNL